MPDDLERRLPDVPAAFPRPDAKVTDEARRRVLALRRPRRFGRRLGVAAAAIVCVAASVGFTVGYWLRPASVHAATSISLAVRPGEAIAWQGGFTLYGSIVNGLPHQVVTIEEKSCGGYEPFHPIVTTETVQGGAFAAEPYNPPAVSMLYRARWKNGTSDPVDLRIRPRVDLSYASGFFKIGVWADGIFRGAVGVVERHDRRLGWVRVGRFTVRDNSFATGGYGYLHASLKRGTNVRAVIPTSQVGRCFIAGFSNIVRV
jgi:hypothetical protein